MQYVSRSSPQPPHPASRVALPLAARTQPERANRGPDRSGPDRCRLAPLEERLATVEYLIRTARITDVDRVVALCADTIRAPRAAAGGRGVEVGDLLRPLVFLPHATFLVAETRREIVGAAVLSLRPSVRAGGYVGTIDLLVVDPRHEAERVVDALIAESLRSAANKACVLVEVTQPDGASDREPWQRHGFAEGGRVISRAVSRATVSATDGPTTAASPPTGA